MMKPMGRMNDMMRNQLESIARKAALVAVSSAGGKPKSAGMLEIDVEPLGDDSMDQTDQNDGECTCPRCGFTWNENDNVGADVSGKD